MLGTCSSIIGSSEAISSIAVVSPVKRREDIRRPHLRRQCIDTDWAESAFEKVVAYYRCGATKEERWLSINVEDLSASMGAVSNKQQSHTLKDKIFEDEGSTIMKSVFHTSETQV